LIYVKNSLPFSVHRLVMDPPEKVPPDKDEPPPRGSRLEEARQIIEEYAADLREFIKKLRRRLN